MSVHSQYASEYQVPLSMYDMTEKERQVLSMISRGQRLEAASVRQAELGGGKSIHFYCD